MNIAKTIFGVFLLLLTSQGLMAQKWITREANLQFFSSTPIEDIEAITNQGSSVIDQSTGQVAFQVLMRSFSFEKALMQEHFNENYVESEQFPNATFAGSIQNASEISWGTPGEYNVTLNGQFELHGVKKSRTVDGVLTIESGKMTLRLEFDVKPEDHDIEIPSAVRDNIARTIDVKAKAVYQPYERR